MQINSKLNWDRMITYTNSLIIVVEIAYSFADIQSDTLLGDILVLESRHSIHTVFLIVFLFVCLFVCLFVFNISVWKG